MGISMGLSAPVSACIAKVEKLEFTDGIAHGVAVKQLGWGDLAVRDWQIHTLLARAIGEVMAGRDALGLHLAEIFGVDDVSARGDGELRDRAARLPEESTRQLALTTLTIRSALDKGRTKEVRCALLPAAFSP